MHFFPEEEDHNNINNNKSGDEERNIPGHLGKERGPRGRRRRRRGIFHGARNLPVHQRGMRDNVVRVND
jgi:hypothetical protein